MGGGGRRGTRGGVAFGNMWCLFLLCIHRVTVYTSCPDIWVKVNVFWTQNVVSLQQTLKMQMPQGNSGGLPIKRSQCSDVEQWDSLNFI